MPAVSDVSITPLLLRTCDLRAVPKQQPRWTQLEPDVKLGLFYFKPIPQYGQRIKTKMSLGLVQTEVESWLCAEKGQR